VCYSYYYYYYKLAAVRPKPVPSRKQRNSIAHQSNGNTDRSKRHLQRHLSVIRLANLRGRWKPSTRGRRSPPPPSSSTIPTPPVAAAPSPPPPSRPRKRRRTQSVDVDWVEEKSTAGRPRQTTATKSTQTTTKGVGVAAVNFQCPQISHQQLFQMQIDGDLSDRQMRVVMRFHRSNISSALYEPCFEAALTRRHQLFAGFFTVVPFALHPPINTVPMAICTDVYSLLQLLQKMHQRRITGVHHSVDAGKNFLKFSFTAEFATEEKIEHQKGRVQSDHGRRRVITTALLPDIKESPESLGIIFKQLDYPVNDFFFSLHADLKADAIATGIGPGSSSCPCPWCKRRITVDQSKMLQMKSGVIRTMRNNSLNYKRFLQSDRTEPSKFFNCVSEPMSFLPKTLSPIRWLRLPQLHLHLLGNWFIKRLTDVFADTPLWYKHFHQQPSEYHGGDFEGNQLHRLSRADSMQYLRRFIIKDGPPSALLFLNAYEAFVQLEHSCFGSVLLDYQTPLANLRRCMELLPVNKVPLKIHVLTAHLHTW